MDSFYGAPRQPPVPTIINRIEKAPVVPEVSVVENSFHQPKLFTPFDHHVSSTLTRPGLNDTSSLHHHKKQVRFESPSAINFKPIRSNSDKENVPEPCKIVPDLNGKTFKQIYMANVPDRHLDLSVFEPSFKEYRFSPESQALPKIDDTDIIRFNPQTRNVRHETEVLRNIENTTPIQYMSPVFRKRKEQTSVENNAQYYLDMCQEIAKPSNEPTIKDLYQIIQEQNEQIMLLQRQVNNLKHSIRQPEDSHFDKPQDHPFMKEITNSPSKKGVFSFDVKTTSFEVSFRPPHGKLRNQNNYLEPKIQEITECDDTKDNGGDMSLHLEESLNLKDSYLSTVPSIQINMDEYQSSDDESDSPGVTFYKDLMDQVNNVLKKMQVQSECQQVPHNKKKHVNGSTMKAVKQATLQHLKSIGVNLSPIQETNEISNENSTETKDYDPSEVSFAVKQLLMKYLPDDKLTLAMNKPKEQHLKQKKYKPGNAEFSFATLQYMKKYNLIDGGKRFQEFEKKKVNDTPKILDVTALKLQPKLL